MDELFEEDRRRRVVLVTRVAFVVGIVGAGLVGWSALSGLLQTVLLVFFGVELVAQLCVLLLASLERWEPARYVLFASWAAIPVFATSFSSPDVMTAEQPELYLCAGAVLLGLASIATVMLTGGRKGSPWVILYVVLHSVGWGWVGYAHNTSFLYYVLLALSSALMVAIVLATRTVTRDLENTVAICEERRLAAATLREEMAVARDEAQAANVAKSRFLANMSHELRTPLTAILGYVELIQESMEDDGNDRYDQDLERVRTSAAHLLELINAVLDLAKVESGKVELRVEDVDVNRLLRELVDTVSPLAATKGLTVELGALQIPGVIRTDGQLLRQIVLNLLSNGLKYTDEGSVCVDGWVDEGELTIEVRDTGVGLAEHEISVIFGAFERTEAEITRRVGGTGLGLSISKRFCELLGGTLTATSTLGKGSVFSVRLPCR